MMEGARALPMVVTTPMATTTSYATNPSSFHPPHFPSQPPTLVSQSPSLVYQPPPLANPGSPPAAAAVPTVYKNEFYQPPNSVPLLAGDPLAARTTYDLQHVRTFRAVDTKYLRRGDRKSRSGRSPSLSDTTTTPWSHSTSGHQCPKGCRCRCHHRGRSTSKHDDSRKRDGSGGRQNRGSQRPHHKVLTRSISCGSLDSALHVREIHIHHYHCPDHPRHRASSPQARRRGLSEDSFSSDGSDLTENLIRAYSPNIRLRETGRGSNNQQYHSAGRGGNQRRRSSLNDDDGRQTRHPYNHYRRTKLNVRRDDDRFGLGGLARRSVNRRY